MSASTSRSAAVGVALALAGAANAGEKAQYNLFNPTPRSMMREMTTDRPDTTEVPFTVDAGHWQTETTAFGFARSRPDADWIASDSFEFAGTNLRIGLTNDVELSLVWQPYGLLKTRGRDGALSERSDGIGSVDVRAKINLWGNDDIAQRGSAAALLPFVTLPTDGDNGIGASHVEGGLVAPIAFLLPAQFDLGINIGVLAVKNESGRGYHAEYITTSALCYDWTDKFDTYVEFVGVFGSDDPRGDAVLLGGGWTYALTDNVQLDGGINFGLTAAADRYNPFIGISVRH